MHMKLVDRMQKNGRVVVGSTASDTAQTKRVVDAVLHLVHALPERAGQARRGPGCRRSSLRHVTAR